MTPSSTRRFSSVTTWDAGSWPRESRTRKRTSGCASSDAISPRASTWPAPCHPQTWPPGSNAQPGRWKHDAGLRWRRPVRTLDSAHESVVASLSRNGNISDNLPWRKVMRLRLTLVLALFSLAGPLVAQTVTGTMRGTVTDRSAGAVPGVTITIRNVDTGLERVVVTDKAGNFNPPFLQIGRYNLRAELSGFRAVPHNN